MFGHLGVAGTTLATLLWGGTPWQDAPSSPPLTFRMEGTVAFRPEDTPKDQFVVFGAGHEIQDTLDIPQPLPAVVCCWFWMPFPFWGKTDCPSTTGPAPPGSWPRHPLENWN